MAVEFDADDIPTTLDGLIAYRDFIYSTLTQDIVALISGKLNSALAEFIPNSISIEWSTMEKVPSLQSCVRMIGSSSPVLGSTAKIADKDVTVTAENARLFRNLIRFTFPIRLLEDGSEEQIISYIKDISYISTIVTEADLEQLLSTYDFDKNIELHDTAEYARIMDKATKPKEILGFSTDFLSDEHIKSLFLAAELVSETKN